MTNLADIARIVITTQGTGIKRPSFNTILVADFHTKYVDRVRSYSSPQGMIDDGFTVNDRAYKAVAAAFAQNPAPTRVKLGRRANAPDLQIDITPTAAHSTRYAIDLVGPAGLAGTAEFISDSNATVAEIVAGLVSAINTLALGITATDQSSTFVRLKAASAGLHFTVKVANYSLLSPQETHADPGIAADLAAINGADSDWYGYTQTTGSEAEVVAASAWIENNKKFAAFDSLDADVISNSTTDVASELQDDNLFRSKVVFRRDSSQFPALGWLARVFGFDPGSTTFEYHSINGVSAEPLTESQVVNLKAKNASAQLDYGGKVMMVHSKVAAGEWMDIVRDRDWFESTMQIDVADAFAQASAAGRKFPFTNAGAAMLEGVLRKSLSKGLSSGFLADDVPEGQNDPYVINVPDASDVALADRQARNYRPIEWSARVAGAIHLTEVFGTLSA